MKPLDRPVVVPTAAAHTGTGQTSGMVRLEAFHSDKFWAGLARNQAGATSAWHHHGAYESAVYVVSGAVLLESGAGGRDAVTARDGDFLFIPAHVIHRESNPNDSEAVVVVVRAGDGELVVNVEGPAPG